MPSYGVGSWRMVSAQSVPQYGVRDRYDLVQSTAPVSRWPLAQPTSSQLSNRFSLSLRNQCAVRGPPRRRPSRARDRKPRVHSDASYQTYCHAKAITITTTAVNRPSCAQTLVAKREPSVLSLWIVMADDLPFGRHL